MVTKQRFKRLVALVLVVAHSLVAGMPVHAGDWMPMLPSQDFYDFQLFAPPDLQEYEIYPEPSEGMFFNYDRLYWGITPPRVAGVGTTQNGNFIIPVNPISPQTVVQLNNANITASGTSGGGSIIGGLYTFGSDPLQLDLNTSWMRTRMGWGNRYEGGWIYDNNGVNISYFSVAQDQSFQTNSEFAASSPTQTFTQEATGGGNAAGGGGVGNINQSLVTTTITSESPPPDHLISQKLTQENSVEIQSVGAAAIIRRELGKRGSGTTARFGLGPRFMQFAERYKLGYESNQYAFNIGGGAGGTTGGGTTGGGTTGGGTTGGGTTGGGTTGGGTTGGGTTGGGQQGGLQGGGLGGGSQLLGGGNIEESLGTGPAGNVLGITGVDSLTGQGLGTALQTGAWETYTSNNMVGPEFSVLFESRQGRWQFSSELKFTAGFNWQNNIYRGSNFPNSLGADYLRATFTPSTTQTAGGTTPPTQLNAPPLFLQIYGVGQNNATNSAEHRFVFTPIGEWRFGTQFRVSEAIRLHAGYTGMWLGSIARASTNTGYITKEKPVKFASPADPSQPASQTNPWVVKQSGPNPGNPPVNADGTPNPYYVPNPEFNSVGAVSGGQEYVLTNGLDFGIEVRY
jgi:hypothetical protein